MITEHGGGRVSAAAAAWLGPGVCAMERMIVTVHTRALCSMSSSIQTDWENHPVQNADKLGLGTHMY